MKGSISTLYSPCNENGTMGGAGGGGGVHSVNGKCSSPGAVRASTLPRNVYHSSSSNQLSLHNEEAVTSFSNNHGLSHHFNVPTLHAVSICYWPRRL